MGSVFSSIAGFAQARPMVTGALVLLVLGAIGYGIYVGFKGPEKKPTADEIGSTLNGRIRVCAADMCAKVECSSTPVCTAATTATTRAATTAPTTAPRTETFANPPSDELFINMQPPTIAHTGLDANGSFKVDTAVLAALKGGIRAFTLQIDMLDLVKSKEFADPGVPTLLYRAPDGSLLSQNSGDIKAVATAIADAAFRPETPSFEEPVIVYLHFVRAPDQVKEAAKYKAYLSKVAAALEPLAPVHLGNDANIGNFHRQLQEEMIIRGPLIAFRGKVIILCNADTSPFKGDTSSTTPKEDLDFWVNMRVYALDAKDKNIGIAQPYSGQGEPTAVITSLDSIVALGTTEALTFGLKGRDRYVIAMPSANPDSGYLDKALNTLGVNMVPIDFLLENVKNAADYKNSYDNMAWPEKIPSLRSNS